MIYNRREAVRRCAEVVGLEDTIDHMVYSFGECRGEGFLKVTMVEAPEKAAFLKTHLGARYAGAPPPVSSSTAQASPNSKKIAVMDQRASNEPERRAATRQKPRVHQTQGVLCPMLPVKNRESTFWRRGSRKVK